MHHWFLHIIFLQECNICIFTVDNVQMLHYNSIRGAIMNVLKNLRIEKELTQQQAAKLLGISLRSYITYENDDTKTGTIKYNYIIEKLKEINPIDEEHGIVTVEYIQNKCTPILKKYNAEYCYLFGSYAKGTENENSDIDIAIISDDFDDIYECMANLMGMTWDIDARIEPHPIKKKDFDEVSDYFIKEVIDTGIKVA